MLSAIEMLLPLIAVVLVVGPLGLMFAGKLNVKNARNRMIAQIALFCGVFRQISSQHWLKKQQLLLLVILQRVLDLSLLLCL